MTKRIATIRIHHEVIQPSDWKWLAMALSTIACEIEKGEHRDSLVLAIQAAIRSPE